MNHPKGHFIHKRALPFKSIMATQLIEPDKPTLFQFGVSIQQVVAGFPLL